MRGSSLAAAAASSAFAWHVRKAHGHAFQTKPIARQYLHTSEFNDGSYGTIEKHADAYNGGGPAVVMERQLERTDPDVLEKYGAGDVWPLAAAWDLGEILPNGNYMENDDIAVSHGVCGDTPQSGDDNPIVYSTPTSEWDVLEEFEPGAIIEIDIIFTNYHWGHVEYFLCDASNDLDSVPKQSCFNEYPLDRADDDSFNSPVDPDYPGRYYIDPPCRGENNEVDQTRPELEGVLMDGTVNHMRYKLPEIETTHAILMMRYHSGAGCKSPGYDEFTPDSWPSECAPDKEDWIATGSHDCNSPGREWGNLFWNCADIAIKSSSGASPVTPTPGPTAETLETPAPTLETPAPILETPAPTPEATEAEPTPAPVMPVAPASTPEPEMTVAPAPTAEPVDRTAAPVGDSAELEAEYLGCHHDSKDDRVLGDMMDSNDMSPEVCLQYCTGKNATFMAVQFGFECWCSDETDLEYERHNELADEDAVCNMPCVGDESVTCGGYDAFDIYKL
ncbi:unnamed protein product [Ectocarpus sp. 4 AP-2014]